ncbi:hypothetical protein ABH931_006173 [Streptacidiphilus sp. MAP12-33]|uniref:hypothetical protein n=1 Tax=Streptacidiphilus sp. MAP12-33 TaxID=3156266 RepID=UPI0035199DD5
MSGDIVSPPPREHADAEFQELLRVAERGGLFPEDFRRADEIRPYVSPDLLR